MHKILYLDDEIEVLSSMRRLYHNFFNIIVEADPKKALNLLKDDKEISVVVTDVNMPRMNGFEFLESIKNNSVIKIVLTGLPLNDELEERCDQLDVLRILTKPCGVDKMVDVLYEAIKLFDEKKVKSDRRQVLHEDIVDIAKFTNVFFEKNSNIILKKQKDISLYDLSIISLLTLNLKLRKLDDVCKELLDLVNSKILGKITKLELYVYSNILKDFPIYKIKDVLDINDSEKKHIVDEFFEPYSEIIDSEFEDPSIEIVDLDDLKDGDRLLGNVTDFDNNVLVDCEMTIFNSDILKKIMNLSVDSGFKNRIMIKRS